MHERTTMCRCTDAYMNESLYGWVIESNVSHYAIADGFARTFAYDWVCEAVAPVHALSKVASMFMNIFEYIHLCCFFCAGLCMAISSQKTFASD